MNTANYVTSAMTRIKVFRILRLPEGLSLAGPSVDMSQQHFDHFSDKIN